MGQISSVPSSVNPIDTTTITPPANPTDALGVSLYWRNLAGLPVLAYKTRYGRENYLLPFNNYLWSSLTFISTTTTNLLIPSGYAINVTGTASNPGVTPASALVRDIMPHVIYTSGVALNNTAGLQVAPGTPQLFRRVSGRPDVGAGGFFLWWRFAPVLDAGHRFAVGVSQSAAISVNEPSALTDCFFIAKDTGDANFQLMHNDAAGIATKIDTGIPAVTNETFDVFFYSAQTDDYIGATIIALNSGAEFTQVITSPLDLPTVDQVLQYHCQLSVAATGIAGQIYHSRMYLSHQI